MNNLAFASIKELKTKILNKELHTEELLSFFIDRFKKYDPILNSALEIFDKDSILNTFTNTSNGLLYGIPGLIKDNICQKGRNLTCASKILENYQATYDATAITNLKNQGALLIGRANMDEFAMGSSTETSHYKKTANPWNTRCVPGGSSGGSAAAVAAGLVPWALGSETGGSVRQPASLCGIVGLKPTYGLISRYGLVAYASSLDQIGIFTRNIYDNALVLSAIAGTDKNDSSTLNVQNQDYTKQLTGKLKENFTLGIIDNALEANGIEDEVYTLLNEAIKTFEKLGAKIKRIKLPMMDYSAAAYFVISRAEAASNLAKFDGVRYGYRSKNAETLNDMYINTREEGFGFEVKSRILLGNYVLSAGHADEFYRSAKVVQGLIRSEFLKAFEEVDLLFSPVSPTTAFEFGKYNDNLLLMDLQDYFTCSVNLAGIPSLGVPCGLTKDQMPVGFQLIGPDLSEHNIYQAAYAYEKETQKDDSENKFVPTNFK
ncbi:Asp-tRNA(Asn)/Glu-tRNA(Gln) amidotransferase subunit GatA [Candidatus Babela massiliensis]|uniref:Glutamyl-tRNA(Gln) amidotransferase subunit A n=1 Tax=Candidatus Babela massiliensis TaxID=673862 RepID=V6DFT6_9BACT|nr:Asp-tRNA(Asn)/Glu-tRNA(Gln) amidotransferase subunit GatA [Candidatus Babela massiliensis]CDK30404.1 Asp-tRNAAsn/Glu-tRNAGln amidotransferase A subunit [Candidatus Babela massiliensis]